MAGRKRERLYGTWSSPFGHRIDESVLELKGIILPYEFMEDYLSHLECNPLHGKLQIHILQLAQNGTSITEPSVLDSMEDSWKIVHPMCLHEDPYYELKAAEASLMAEEVKLMYSPWSSSCSLKIEFEVQKALQVIRSQSCTEEGLANKLNCSPLEYMEKTWKNIPDSFIAEKSPKMRLVVWQPPFSSWIKVNTDGLSKGNPGLSACGGVFRSDSCDFLGGFAVALGTQSAYYAELMAVFLAVHIAHSKGWLQLWIESDCLTVVQAIQNRKLNAPKELKNLWNNSLQKMKSMNIYCSHIFREGNNVADMLANLGLNYPRLQWWVHPPTEIQELLLHDFWGLPNYRVC